MRALADAHLARLSSRHFALTRARTYADARSKGCVSCNEDGGDSGDSLAAESNAQPVQLVAQLAQVDARGVRSSAIPLCLKHRGSVFSERGERTHLAGRAMTGTGH